MGSQELLSELIGDIYEASYQPDHWPMVIEKITRLTGSRSGGLYIQDKTIREANGFYPYGLTEEVIEGHAKVANLDPGYQIMQEKPPGKACNMQNNKQHALESSEYYQFRLDSDTGYVAGASVMVEEEQHVGLGLHRSFSASAYEEETLQLISELIPHLQRALRIHREFIRLRVEKAAITAGFDSLMMGLVLFDHLGEPVYSNPVADSILNEHPAIERINNRIVPTRREDGVELYRLLTTCLGHNSGASEARGGVMGLHHPDCPHPLAVMVKPVNSSELANVIDGVPVYAAMYLSDPGRPLPIAAETISTLYGLTRTEAKVTIALVNGLGIDEIASTNSRSVNTIRTHLKAIYQKTHTANQADLVRLLLAGGSALMGSQQ